MTVATILFFYCFGPPRPDQLPLQPGSSFYFLSFLSANATQVPTRAALINSLSSAAMMPFNSLFKRDLHQKEAPAGCIHSQEAPSVLSSWPSLMYMCSCLRELACLCVCISVCLVSPELDAADATAEGSHISALIFCD